MTWTTALRGTSGTIELNRLVGFVGGMAYVGCANVFVAWDTMVKGHDFDITAYCLSFPAGLAVVAGGTAAAVALKDRQVATAHVIQETGSQPGKAAEGAAA
jgi:hypothetical protein